MSEGWRVGSASLTRRCCFAVLTGLALGAMPAHAAESACRIAEDAAGGSVAGVVDERTLRLTDGTEIRLAGLESLADLAAPAMAGAWAAGAKAALERLALGKTIAVQPLGEDRFGRRMALVAGPGDAGSLLQERLIGQGHGLVSARIGDPSCRSRFQAAERAARSAGLGLWSDRPHLIYRADRPDPLSAVRGRFALVEGTVVSVNDRGATVYVNFGRRWSEDFTVTIPKRSERLFAAAGAAPKSFEGRRVRVRGHVEERGGPMIEAVRPEQIEFAE